MNKINKIYHKIIRSDLILKNKYKNILKVPEINKITLNITAKNNLLEPLIALELITNQKGVLIKAKKSIASFNLRKNMYISSKVTLRDENMYNFLNKLTNLIFPKIKEFKGIPLKNINKDGNLGISVNNITIFPEIEYQYELFNDSYGIDINIVTTSNSVRETKLLLSSFQIPFKK